MYNRYFLSAQGFVVSAIVSTLLITGLIIVGELYAPLKTWLKDTFFHHWIGKGVLGAITFLVLGAILQFSFRRIEIGVAMTVLAFIAAFCAIAIVAFFGYEVFLAS